MMSDRRPETPELDGARAAAREAWATHDGSEEEALNSALSVFENHVMEEAVAVVRSRVESGTIKGSVVDHEYGKLIIIPVSDGGSET